MTVKSRPVAETSPDTDLRNDLKWTQRIGWTIAGGFVVVFSGFLVWYFPKELATNRELIRSDTANQLAPITQDIAGLKAQITALNGIIPQLMKDKLSVGKTGLKSALDSVASFAREARNKQIETDSAALGDIGIRVVEIGNAGPAEVSSAAWHATTELLNYRSFLDVKSIPVDITKAVPLTQAPVPLGISIPGRVVKPYPGYPYPGIRVDLSVKYLGPIVSIESSALFEPLGQNSQTRPSQVGPTYLVVESKGFEIFLDGQRMRNVIFKDAVIVYDGGPVALQNVYLANCEFKFKPNPEWKQLSEAVFAKNSLSFSRTASP